MIEIYIMAIAIGTAVGFGIATIHTKREIKKTEELICRLNKNREELERRIRGL